MGHLQVCESEEVTGEDLESFFQDKDAGLDVARNPLYMPDQLVSCITNSEAKAEGQVVALEESGSGTGAAAAMRMQGIVAVVDENEEEVAETHDRRRAQPLAQHALDARYVGASSRRGVGPGGTGFGSDSKKKRTQ
eukprot:2481975-Rhodomonas_salina.2